MYNDPIVICNRLNLIKTPLRKCKQFKTQIEHIIVGTNSRHFERISGVFFGIQILVSNAVNHVRLRCKGKKTQQGRESATSGVAGLVWEDVQL